MYRDYFADEDDEEDDQTTSSKAKFKVYGTPFPSLKDDELPTKKPDIDLTVRDEEGRRRFHGAFTGGFSAGYWNTVGSKEGWVPAQYVSSRKEKWDKNVVKRKPEDFMDDEDFKFDGISPQTVHTKEQFSSDPISDFLFARPAAVASNASSTGDISEFLKQTIKPAKLSVGLQILKRLKATSKNLKEKREEAAMIAAEAEKRAKKEEKKSFGCALPPGFAPIRDSDDEEEEDEEEEPDETSGEPDVADDEDIENSFASYKSQFERKTNRHGLGYRGMLQPNASSSSIAGASQTPLSLSASVGGKKLKISGHAFGTGVLNEENDEFDDVNLYDKEDMSNYDFEMRGERKNRNKKLRTTLADSGNRSLDDLFVKQSSHAFSLTKIQSLSKKYPPPEIPTGWKRPTRSKSPTPTSHKSAIQKSDSTDDAKGKKKSRWDVPAASERVSPPSGSSSSKLVSQTSGPGSSRSIHSSHMDANVRSLMLGEGIRMGVNRPSGTKDQSKSDEGKEDQQDMRKGSERLDQRTEKDVQQHQRTPLFGFFANKFTHSSSASGASDAASVSLEAGLTKSTDIKSMTSERTGQKSEEAAKERVSLIGTSDRITLPWIPGKLLCKRFDVPPPGSKR